MYCVGDIIERIIISNTDRLNPIFTDGDVYFLITKKDEHYLEVSGKQIIIYTLTSLKTNRQHSSGLRDTRNWKKIA